MRLSSAAALALLALAAPFTPARADDASRLPVREVTVFKDGHAFVLREGTAAVGEGGRVVLDDLPNPVLGTFWPYAAPGSGAPSLRSVIAARENVAAARDAAGIPDLLAANVGASVRVRDAAQSPPQWFDATVQSVRGSLVLFKTAEGLRPMDAARVADIVFVGDSAKTTLPDQQARDRLTLTLDGAAAGGKATVGLMYLQRGIRWIPDYRVSLDGKGHAKVSLQATILNELTDLDRATVHLVVGAPSFAFEDTPDPVGLADAFPQLSRYFQTGDRTGYALQNAAIMTQGARAGEYGAFRRADAPADPTRPGGGGDAPGEGNEDLFLFTLKDLTLKKGERMVLPVAEFTLPYRDVYTLELPPLPPRDPRAGYAAYAGGGNVSAELMALLAAPKVQHKIRFTNAGPYPLTTAPTLILSGGKIVAQGTMSYTPKGANSDVTLTGAVDIEVTRSEKEAKRTPNAETINGDAYTSVDLTGKLCFTNRGERPAALEVKRYVIGAVTEAPAPGVADAVDPFSDAAGLPSWWGSYVAPSDWARVNPIGRVTWKATVAPGKTLDLTYAWRYLTR
jgi:hypothetical protein